MKITISSLLLALSLSLAPAVGAQVAVDVAAGIGRGLGGPQALDRSQMALSATVALPVGMAPRGKWMVALSAAVDVGMEGVACLADVVSSCDVFPILGSVGALAGWSQHADVAHGLRLLAGPAFVGNEPSVKQGMGAMVKADWASPVVNHLSFVAGVRGLLAPRWRRERIGTASLHLGIRVH